MRERQRCLPHHLIPSLSPQHNVLPSSLTHSTASLHFPIHPYIPYTSSYTPHLTSPHLTISSLILPFSSFISPFPFSPLWLTYPSLPSLFPHLPVYSPHCSSLHPLPSHPPRHPIRKPPIIRNLLGWVALRPQITLAEWP